MLTTRGLGGGGLVTTGGLGPFLVGVAQKVVNYVRYRRKRRQGR